MMKKVDWIQAIEDVMSREDAIRVYAYLVKSSHFTKEEIERIQDKILKLTKEGEDKK